MHTPDVVIEMSDGEDGEWVPVSRRHAVRIDDSTWELAVPNVNERRRFRVNGRPCSWQGKSNELRVLVRTP
jgi:hypothetical protein